VNLKNALMNTELPGGGDAGVPPIDAQGSGSGTGGGSEGSDGSTTGSGTQPNGNPLLD
jgi:hypothetical protein